MCIELQTDAIRIRIVFTNIFHFQRNMWKFVFSTPDRYKFSPNIINYLYPSYLKYCVCVTECVYACQCFYVCVRVHSQKKMSCGYVKHTDVIVISKIKLPWNAIKKETWTSRTGERADARAFELLCTQSQLSIYLWGSKCVDVKKRAKTCQPPPAKRLMFMVCYQSLFNALVSLKSRINCARCLFVVQPLGQ